MGRWYKNGVPIEDEDLGELGLTDGETLLEHDGVVFLLSVGVAARHPAARDLSPAYSAPLQLTFKQLSAIEIGPEAVRADLADSQPEESLLCDQVTEHLTGRVGLVEVINRAARRRACEKLLARTHGGLHAGVEQAARRPHGDRTTTE